MTGTVRALRNGRDEISIVPTLFEQSQALTSLDGRPLAVLTAAASLEGEGWRAAQDRLAQLSDNRLTRTVQSSHAGLVTDAPVALESAAAITAVVSQHPHRSAPALTRPPQPTSTRRRRSPWRVAGGSGWSAASMASLGRCRGVGVLFCGAALLAEPHVIQREHPLAPAV